jgi:hypothetical protein
MTKETPAFEAIEIKSQRDLAIHMRTIVTRLNENPEIARRALVNPIYALNEVGVQLTKEMEKHIHDTLHEPPAKKRRLAELESELKPELERLTGRAEIPALPARRAQLLFETLNLTPTEEEHRTGVDARVLRSYVQHHPLVAKLAEHEGVRKSGLVFHRREIYEAYKRGEMKQNWGTQ